MEEFPSKEFLSETNFPQIELIFFEENSKFFPGKNKHPTSDLIDWI